MFHQVKDLEMELETLLEKYRPILPCRVIANVLISQGVIQTFKENSERITLVNSILASVMNGISVTLEGRSKKL